MRVADLDKDDGSGSKVVAKLVPASEGVSEVAEKSGEPSGTRTRDSLLKRSDPEQPEPPSDDPSSQEHGEHE